MNNRFDNICRAVASPIPRRGFFRFLLAAFAGAVTAPQAFAALLCGSQTVTLTPGSNICATARGQYNPGACPARCPDRTITGLVCTNGQQQQGQNKGNNTDGNCSGACVVQGTVKCCCGTNCAGCVGTTPVCTNHQCVSS